MEYFPADDARVRRSARQLRAELAPYGIDPGADGCLDLVARLLGHVSFAALRRRIGKVQPSPYDDACDEATVMARRSHQASVLSGIEGLDDVGVAEVIDSLRPTARRHLRGPGSRSLVSLLDVTQDRCEPLGDERFGLMSELLMREEAGEVHRDKGAPGPFATFLRSVPENVRAVASHFREGQHEATFGLVMLLGHLSRSREEATLWVATLKEMWRRMGGGTVRIGHFAEAFASGVPNQEAVAETWARRRAGERTTGFPRYPQTVPDGAVGFMLARPGAPPRVICATDWADGEFMARHARMLEGAPADPTSDLDANLGLCASLIQDTAHLPEGDPEARRAMGLLLWLALVNPNGAGRAEQALSSGRGRYVTMTLSQDARIRTSVADAFEDRTRMLYA